MPESCNSLRGLTRLVERLRFCILPFWLVALCVGGLGAINFIPACTLSFNPQQGMRSYGAESRFNELFPGQAKTTQWLALLQVDSPAKVMDQMGLNNFSIALLASLNESGRLMTYTSATSLNKIDPKMASKLISASGNATMIQWVTPELFSEKSNLDFATTSHKKFDDLRSRYLPDIAFGDVISLSSFTNIAISDAEISLLEMDAVSIPLAFFVFWLMIKSGRLLILPAMGMGTSLSVSFGIMYLVTLVEDVEQTTPSLMMSILIAMSVDYSLFILTRFRTELSRAASLNDSNPRAMVREAMLNTMQTAGFTVLLSCVTLMISFLALIFAPVTLISSLGLGCAVSLVIALAVHLTLLPAIVLTFPEFFSYSVSPERLGARCLRSCCPFCSRRRDGPAAIEADAETLVRDAQREGEQKAQHPFFTCLARATTSFPANVIIVFVIVGVTVAIGSAVLSLKTTANVILSVPRGSDAAEGIVRLSDSFGVGTMTPYQLLLENPSGNRTIFEEPFWSYTQQVLKNMSSVLPDTRSEDFTFVSYAAGIELDLEEVVLPCWKNRTASELCAEIGYLLDQFINADATAMYGFITLSWDPLDRRGNAWLSAARAFIDEAEARVPVRMSLCGEGADTFDIINSVYGFFPVMVAITLGVALVMLGCAFRSLMIPVRSVASIVLTLLFVYGMTTLTYQRGIFDWTTLPGLTGKFKSQQWFIPAISFSVVCGICLDYDIFLLSRATEFREKGMTALEATREALCSTGGIITAAGVIMAIAFLGLMFASMIPLNELSFFLVFATLYDTFIIRSLFSPALMSLLGRYTWFPSKLSKDA